MTLPDLAMLIGMFTSLAAIIGLVLETRSSRLALQTQALLGLEERFYSSRMTSLRQIAARNLLANCELNPELEDTLDFLHTVCMLVERRVINRDLAIEFYQYWIARYWLVSKPYV